MQEHDSSVCVFCQREDSLARNNIRLPTENFEHLNSLTLTSIVFDKGNFPWPQVNFHSLINHCQCLITSAF